MTRKGALYLLVGLAICRCDTDVKDSLISLVFFMYFPSFISSPGCHGLLLQFLQPLHFSE